MKMLFKILSLSAFVLAILSAQGMEKEAPTVIPTAENIETALTHFPDIYSQCEQVIKSPEFKQEEDKFKKYKLGYDKFIQYLKQISYKPSLPNPLLDPNVDYLIKLELVSMALWYQHYLMQNFIDSLCFYLCENKIKEIENRWTGGTNNFNIHLTNMGSIGTFYFYGPLFVNTPSDLNLDIKKIINELNTNKDPEISQFACILNIKTERNFINGKTGDLNTRFKMLTEYIDRVLLQINAPEITHAKLFEMYTSKISEEKINQIINTMGNAEIIAMVNKYAGFIPEDSFVGFLRNNKKYVDECYKVLVQLKNQNSFTSQRLIESIKGCILRYTLVHKSYEKLYRLIREEVENFVKRCISANKNDAEKFSRFLNNPLLPNKTPFDPTLLPLGLSKDTIRLAEIHKNLTSLKDTKLNAKSVGDFEKKIEISNTELIKSSLIKNALDEKSRAVNDEKTDTQKKQPGKTKNKKKKQTKAQNKKDIINTLEDLAEAIDSTNITVEEPELIILHTPSVQKQAIPNGQLKAKQKKEPNKTILADGSYIVQGEETERTIVIHDPKNNMTIELWKRLKESDLKKDSLVYKENIKEWFEDPKAALSKKVYPEKPDLNNPKHYKKLAIHSFAKFVDQFIEKHGTKCMTSTGKGEHSGEEEAAIIIPGTIFYENGEQEGGLFSYIIDQEGKCFHRMFDVRKNTDLIKQISSAGCLNYYEK